MQDKAANKYKKCKIHKTVPSKTENQEIAWSVASDEMLQKSGKA